MDMECVFCVNCGSASASMVLENKQILHCIQSWTAPRLIQAHDLICIMCWTEASNLANVRDTARSCVLCNITLPPRTRSHQVIALRTDTQHHINIRNIILERMLPLQVHASHYICHPCWQRADRAARHFSVSSASSDTPNRCNQMRCINCGINLNRMQRHILYNEVILAQVQLRVAPRIVTATDYICNACYILLANRDATTEETPSVGHQKICLGCGRSLSLGRSYIVCDERNRHILHVVQSWVQPQEIQPSDLICHPCLQRAEAAIEAPSSNPPVHAETVTLPNYSRAAATHSRCIFPQCHSTQQQVVPFSIRVRLFADHNFYIPSSCRICEFHLRSRIWSDLLEVENVNRSFKAAYIEDFCLLLKNDKNPLDFENIEQLDEHLVWYLLGHTKEQFRELEAEIPDFPKRATALGAYLIKLRTGDSDLRISSLLNIPRSTLNKLVTQVRDKMVKVKPPAEFLNNILIKNDDDD